MNNKEPSICVRVANSAARLFQNLLGKVDRQLSSSILRLLSAFGNAVAGYVLKLLSHHERNP